MPHNIIRLILFITVPAVFGLSTIATGQTSDKALNPIPKINPGASRFQDLRPIEHKTLDSKMKMPEAGKLSTPTTLLPPDYFCEFIDYSGGQASYYWRVPHPSDIPEFGVRFTSHERYDCTLLTVWIGAYPPPITGTPDIKVTIYSDDGFGLPGMELGSVIIPFEDLPTSIGYVGADLTPLGPPVFSDGDEFHIGVSVANPEPDDTLAILSDDGSHGLRRSWMYYDGDYLLIDDAWQQDFNFLIGVDICCAEIPFSDCYRRDFYCEPAYDWPLPNACGDEYFSQRIQVYYADTLKHVGVALDELATVGTPDMEVVIWPDDGFGLPDMANELARAAIPYEELVFYPEFNVVDVSALELVFRDDFHVGWKVIGGPNDTLAAISDDGTCGIRLGTVYSSGSWNTMYDAYGVDVNFLVYAYLCFDPYYRCRTLSDNCGADYFWKLPDQDGNTGNYQKFSPYGISCRLEKLKIALFDDDDPASNPYAYNSEVQVWSSNRWTGLPDSLLLSVTLMPGDYVLYPGWTEVDFTALPSQPFIFNDEIWVGIESLAPDEQSGIRTISDAGNCGQLHSAQKRPDGFGFMVNDWGVDVNFMMELEVCCEYEYPPPCWPGDEWPAMCKDFNRTDASHSSLGVNVQGNLTKEWQYNADQIAAYNSPVIYSDTIVCYFLDHVVALALEDGSEIWKRPADGYEIGSACYATPSIMNFDAYGAGVTLVFTPGGDAKSFNAINLADGSTYWTRNHLAHSSHFMTWGVSVVADINGVPVVFYNDDNGDIYAVEALTGNLFSGWSVNPRNFGGAVYRGLTLGDYRLYVGTDDNITNGDIYCVDATTGDLVWQFADHQLCGIDPDNCGTESFTGVIAWDFNYGMPLLFASSVYDPSNTASGYHAGGVLYSIRPDDGVLNWANLCIGQDYSGVAVGHDEIVNIGWTPWVPGYGELRGPTAYRKYSGAILWANTTGNPGLGDYWLMDGLLSCELDVPDWYVSMSRSNFLGFYNLEDGAMQFHRRISSPPLAGHRVAPIMVHGYLITTCGNKMFALTGKEARPRLDIPEYAINVPVDFDSPDHYPVEFPDALGNVGGAPLTIDSVVLGDIDNGTSPPPSASLSPVSGHRAEAMAKMAKKFAGNADKLRASLANEELFSIDETADVPTQSGKAAYALPSWVYGVVYPTPGTVIPAQYPYNDSSAYIDIVIEVNGTQIPRGTHSFYAHIYSDDPDYFLDSARIDYETDYLPPQIRLGVIGGCTYDDVEMYFGVGAANYVHVWNATKLADGDLDDSWEIDGDQTSFWQGAYIFAAEQAGAIPPGKPSIFSARVAHYAENWSGVNPMAWQSILADPNCFNQTCAPKLRTDVYLGQISHDQGATYDNVFGEIVCYAFVDSVQDMCRYDTEDNCLKWDWTAAESGTQPPFSDTLTIGFRGCVTVIGAYDEPLLNNFVIHRFDLSGRYGPVNDLYMGAMLDYDIIHNVCNVAGYDEEHSLAYTYPCNTNDNGWGMVRIPFGDEYPPMINAKTLTAGQAGWNDSAVWLDSVHYWMSNLSGLSHQTGIDPDLCNTDPNDREVFFTIAGLDLPEEPESETIGVALFGMPGVDDASDPATYSELADIANMWCGFGRGDVNSDKRIDLVDIAYLIDYVFYSGNGPYPFRHLGDVDTDGVINGNDVTYLIEYYLGLGPAPRGGWTLGH